MLNPCWSNTKRFLSVLVVFGKFFVFTKIVKNSVALFWRLSYGLVQLHTPVASPHRDLPRLTGGTMSQSWKILRIFFKILGFYVSRGLVWRLVRGWKVYSRGVHRDFRGLPRDSLAGRLSSCEKHLENISNFVFKCSGGWPWRLARYLTQSRTSHVLHKEDLFQYWFQKGSSFFPRIQWIFIF